MLSDFNPKIVVAVLLVLSVGCHKESLPPQKVYSATIGPLFQEEHTGKVSYTFDIHNPSKTQVMKLNLEQRSCSCITSVVGKSEIGPGETGQITLTTTPSFSSDEQFLSAVYSTGIEELPRILTKVRLKSYRRVTIEPDLDHLSAVTIAPGTSQEIPFRVMHRIPEDQDSVDLNLVADNAATTIERLRQQHFERVIVSEYDARIRIDCPLDIYDRYVSRDLSERIRLFERDRCLADFRVRWRPIEFVRAIPRAVILNTRASDRIQKELSLIGNHEFRVVDVICSVPDVVCETLSSTTEKAHKIRLTLDSSHADSSRLDQRQGTILIETDLKLQPTVGVSVLILK